MFYAILEFVMQASLLFLLVAMLILFDLLRRTVRARRLSEESQLRETERRRNAARRARRSLDQRVPVSVRTSLIPNSLAAISIRRAQAMPGIRRGASLGGA